MVRQAFHLLGTMLVEAFVVALVVITSNCIKAIIAIKAAYLIAMDLPEPCFPF